MSEKYKIIYADPPWRFSSRGARSGRYGKLDYSTMSLKELCDLGVASIADANSALFLWVPGAFLLDSRKVFDSWGFKYIRVEAVWEKVKPSGKKHAVCGPWGMNEAEFLLMGIRGSMASNQQGKRNLSTIVRHQYMGRHSEKPGVFRERIEFRFGKVKKIELFARHYPEGWDVWGEEVKSKICL
jgi:DNA (cytosine-5)-methyltransferase 1